MGETPGDLGVKLHDLWWDERCSWHVDFDGGAGASLPWTVVLEWTQERGNQHDADWVTFVWQFYDETIEGALREAIEWCEGLVPFERCSGCDGDGAYGLPDARKVCDDCGGSGLAHPDGAAEAEK